MKNPFNPDLVYLNDPDGYILPYAFSGDTDSMIMKYRYTKLRKSSYGFIVRLGIAQQANYG